MGFTEGTVPEDNRLQMTTSLTAQATYVWCNNEAHLHSHWCCAKAISIVCVRMRVCMCVLIIKLAKHMHHFNIVTCGLSGSTIFFHIISQMPQISNFMKICPVGAELFHGHRDTMKLIVAFHNFAIVRKNCTDHQHSKLLACLLYHHLKYRYVFSNHWNFLFTQRCYSSIWSSRSTSDTYSMSFILRPLLPFYWLTQIAKHQVHYDLENTAFGKFCRK